MTLKKYNIINISLLFFLIQLISFSQNKSSKYSKIGHPFVKYFSPKEYKGATANWSIVQDKNGVMYFGNQSGVLEYDGNSWRKIETPNSESVRAMAVDSSGKIFLCATSDFGYLEPDSIGLLRYKSLMPYLDKEYRNFGEMWDVAASKDYVFFKTEDKIFRWNGNEFFVWDSVYAFRLYNINDTIYSRNRDVGLMMVVGDSLKVMPDGGFFSSTGVFDMLPLHGKYSKQQGEILVTTNYSGLFISDGNKFSKFKTNADSFLINNQIYNACITADSNFALATQRGGVAIINRDGKLIRVINEESGLPTNVVYDVYPDRNGGLWLATVNGIAYCEVPSPFSIIQNNGPLKNISYSVFRFNNKLYVTNELGVLYKPNDNSKLQLVKGSNKPAYFLIEYNGALLAATNWGVVLIKNYQFKKTIINSSTEFLVKSKIYPGRIYAAHRNGFTVIQNEGNNRFTAKFTKNMDEDVNRIVEESDGSLWLAGFFPGIYHVSGDLHEFSNGSDENIKYKYYDNKIGLPGKKLGIYKIHDNMLLATDKGAFSFEKESKSFIRDSTFGNIFADSVNAILDIKNSTDDNLWLLGEFNGERELGKAYLKYDGTYKWEPDRELKRLDLNTYINMYSDPNPVTNKEILWINTDDALVRYNTDKHKEIDEPYSTLIRKVIVNNDSLIFGGAKLYDDSYKEIVLPFTKRDIICEYSALSFDRPGANLYQYYLEGNDKGWSQWTSEIKKEYTNLPEGSYKFHVHSLNIYGTPGSEDTISFTILPPWYRTWWAYSLFALIFILGVYFFDRIMRRAIIKKERNIAKLREADLIKKQAEELETVDRLVRVINSAEDLETLFNSLLIQTVSFIPEAEKAAVFLLDHNDGKFHVEYTLGFMVNDLESITFLPEELIKRYTEDSEEIEKGIYIVSNTENMYADEKMSKFSKAKSMLVMAVEWDDKPEAYVVFDSFAGKNVFDPSAARILNRFREHAVSAISKAQSLKTLKEKNEEIIKTQEQLIIQQKLASLGALTAGIAHEIKNPLNFVNNFAEVSSEMILELKEIIANHKSLLQKENYEEIEELIENLEEIFKKINNHGNRAESIIKRMLLHSRGKSGEKVPTDLNELLNQYLNLAYHGLRAKDKSFNITIFKDYDKSIGKISIVQQDISRVLLNVINNACYAANEKNKIKGTGFDPTIKVWTKNLNDKIEIHVWDNGNGIPKDVQENLFNPFFTTKPSGEGTGLGLSISYEIIVKEHNGTIDFNTEEGKFTEFRICLPKK